MGRASIRGFGGSGVSMGSIMTLVLSNEVLKETDVCTALVRDATGLVHDLRIHACSLSTA